MVFQRYCHVYTEGELESIVAEIPGARVVDSFMDTGNWVLVIGKM